MTSRFFSFYFGILGTKGMYERLRVTWCQEQSTTDLMTENNGKLGYSLTVGRVELNNVMSP
jgi:hypothetical protein